MPGLFKCGADAGHLNHGSDGSLSIEPLHIALLADGQSRVGMNPRDSFRTDELFNRAALQLQRRDKGGDHHQAAFHPQPGDLGGPA